ncbi:hypothetical protein MMC10_008486 [Thelotrema lepadinum]|nr:hypothetical protein [Thelotrema lepadinum]
MASSPSSDPTKARIISHMNADHAPSLTRYLEAFTPTGPLGSRSPTLTDITLTSLVITSSATPFAKPISHTIPLNPPMSSISEARPRLVELDLLATKKLGRSHSTVSRFTYPTFLGWGIIIGVVSGLVLFTDSSNFTPESVLGRTLFRPVPWARGVCERNNWTLWTVIFGLHTAETYILLGRLRKWNVPLFSGTWWAWVGCQFLEGMTGLKRYQAEAERVERVRGEKEKKDGGH